MKKIIALLLISITVLTFAFSSPAFAAIKTGEQVFNAKCAACHKGGKNSVKAKKNLKKETLEKYGMYSEAAIITQVTNGKGAMPKFKKKLKAEEIENVAKYVLEQADLGWPKK